MSSDDLYQDLNNINARYTQNSQTSQFSFRDYTVPSQGSSSQFSNADYNKYASSSLTPNDYNNEMCAYCKVRDTESLCLCHHCNKWFCNGKGSTNSSHIIFHLVKSRTKQVRLHHNNPSGVTDLECYNCSSRNVFMLGFVPAREESVVIILCRHPCTAKASLKEIKWVPSEWSPIIKERQFVKWIVSACKEKDQQIIDDVTVSQMTKLEILWAAKPEAKLEDLPSNPASDVMYYVSLTYPDMDRYKDTYSSLVTLESNYDKEMTEKQKQINIVVRWEYGDNDKRIAYVELLKTDIRLSIGDGIKLSRMEGDVENVWFGEIEKLAAVAGDEVAVSFSKFSDVPMYTYEGYCVQFIWKCTAFRRMQRALKLFHGQDEHMAVYIKERILGNNVVETISNSHKMPIKFNVPGLPVLNHSQVNAVRTVLERQITLIQGPPGTGKTVTSATIVYHLVSRNNGKILVCAPSNIAVDQLTEKIAATGVKVLRVTAYSREATGTSVDNYSLHNQILKIKGNEEFKKLHNLRESGELNQSDKLVYMKIKGELEEKLVGEADVVCATCVSAGDRKLKKSRFKYVLIDEATQATEPECMIPIVRNCKQLILVGDHRQLGPVVMCKNAARGGLTTSLFERLALSGIEPLMLKIQYRMHPCLSSFPSDAFYDGSLQNGVCEADRANNYDIPWPNRNKPMFFWATQGQEEMSETGTSYLNRTEAANVSKISTCLLEAGVSPDQIGIITPYEGQRSYLVQHVQLGGSLNPQLYKDIEIASVDAFQGREKDYIILSCVRANQSHCIGFLNNTRRLNVAITRAKYGLVIIGNPRILARQKIWNKLLTHYMEQGLLVQGPLSNLTEYPVDISKIPIDTKINFQKNTCPTFNMPNLCKEDGNVQEKSKSPRLISEEEVIEALQSTTIQNDIVSSSSANPLSQVVLSNGFELFHSQNTEEYLSNTLSTFGGFGFSQPNNASQVNSQDVVFSQVDDDVDGAI